MIIFSPKVKVIASGGHFLALLGKKCDFYEGRPGPKAQTRYACKAVRVLGKKCDFFETKPGPKAQTWYALMQGTTERKSENFRRVFTMLLGTLFVHYCQKFHTKTMKYVWRMVST